MGLSAILLALVFLIWFAYRGWSILLLAPLAAILAALLSGEPALAHWTLTFMRAGADFVARYFPLFLLGALFGKLMDDSGSLKTIQPAPQRCSRPPAGGMRRDTPGKLC